MIEVIALDWEVALPIGHFSPCWSGPVPMLPCGAKSHSPAATCPHAFAKSPRYVSRETPVNGVSLTESAAPLKLSRDVRGSGAGSTAVITAPYGSYFDSTVLACNFTTVKTEKPPPIKAEALCEVRADAKHMDRHF